MRRGRRGFTLVEVAVALVVLAVAGAALQELVVRSLRTIDDGTGRARTLVAARARLAEASLLAPAPAVQRWTAPDGVTTTRSVRPTAHPALFEVRVRAELAGGREASELVELIYAPVR